MMYHELDEVELGGINLELEGDFPLRQLITLTDDEGEEGFIPFNKIIVMEVMNEVIFQTLKKIRTDFFIFNQQTIHRITLKQILRALYQLVKRKESSFLRLQHKHVTHAAKRNSKATIN